MARGTTEPVTLVPALLLSATLWRRTGAAAVLLDGSSPWPSRIPWQLVDSPLKDVWVASSLGPCE